MNGTVWYILGQCLGGVAVLLGFFSFQQKTPKRILAFEIASAAVFTAHYLLLGAITAVALNALGIVQCTAYYLQDVRGKKGIAVPLIFTLIVILSGILTWEGWNSAFLLVGLVVYSVSIALPSAQYIRYAMFIKAPLCMVYNILALSIGGVCYEVMVILSAVIGTARYYRDNRRSERT